MYAIITPLLHAAYSQDAIIVFFSNHVARTIVIKLLYYKMKLKKYMSHLE